MKRRCCVVALAAGATLAGALATGCSSEGDGEPPGDGFASGRGDGNGNLGPNAGSGNGGSGFGNNGDVSGEGAPPLGQPLRVGAACDSDGDCSEGLSCLLESTVFGGTLPGGSCTRSCTNDGDCWRVDPDAVCVGSVDEGVCVATCAAGEGSSAKCGGRLDVACVVLATRDGGAAEAVCQPLCSSDAQCPGDLVCDARLAVCVDAADRRDGLPIGSPCDPANTTDPCEGFCVETEAGSGVCTQSCALGVAGGCGTHPAPDRLSAACTLTGGSAGAPGDLGLCGQLCDCNADCRHPAWRCLPWEESVRAANEAATGRAGSCQPIGSGAAGDAGASADGGDASANTGPAGLERCPSASDGGMPNSDAAVRDAGGTDAPADAPSLRDAGRPLADASRDGS